VPVSNGLVLVLVLTLADPDPAAFRSDHPAIQPSDGSDSTSNTNSNSNSNSSKVRSPDVELRASSCPSAAKSPPARRAARVTDFADNDDEAFYGAGDGDGAGFGWLYGVDQE